MEYKVWMRQNKTWLCEHTPNLDSFMRHLYSAKLLDGDVKAEIEAMASTSRQGDRLYDNLVQWGPERVPDVITCAEEADMPPLANKFRGLIFGATSISFQVASFSRPSSLPSPFWFGVEELGYLFMGRDEQLKTLHRMLTGSRSSDSARSNVICISGMGGIGKTSLAKKYARTKMFAEYYDSKVIWVNAESLESLTYSFDRLTTSAQQPVAGTETRTPPEIIAAVYDALNQLSKPPLIIFDNAENFALLTQFLPKLTNHEDPPPYILVTTRYDDFTGFTRNQLQLQPLETDESVQLIREQLPACSTQAAEQLADRLDGFPLIIQQALSYIKATHIENDNGITKYLDELNGSSPDLLDDRTLQNWDDSYTETAWTVCSMTLAKIRKSCEPAYELIKKLSFLSPETSQKFLETLLNFDMEPELKSCGPAYELMKKLSILSPETSRRVLNTLLNSEMESRLKILAKHSLITLHKCRPVTISTHRIVQQVVRRGLEPDDEKKVFQEVSNQLGVLIRSYDHKTIGNEIISQTLNLMRLQLDSPALTRIGLDYLDERLGLAFISEICAGLIKHTATNSLSGYQRTIIEEYMPEPGTHVANTSPEYIFGTNDKRRQNVHALCVSIELFGPNNRISAHILYSMALDCLTSRHQATALKLICEARNWLGELHTHLKLICRSKEAWILSELRNQSEAMEVATWTYINCLECFGNEYFERLGSNNQNESRLLEDILKFCRKGIDSYYDCRSYGTKHRADLLRQRRYSRFEVPSELTNLARLFEERQNAGRRSSNPPPTTMSMVLVRTGAAILANIFDKFK